LLDFLRLYRPLFAIEADYIAYTVELSRYSRQRITLFNRSFQATDMFHRADESRSFDMNILEAIQKSIESAKGPFSVVKNTSEIRNLESSFEDRPGGDMNKQPGTENIFARQSSNGSGGSDDVEEGEEISSRKKSFIKRAIEYIKTILEPADDDHKRILYKRKQESARKDVERAFGVLKKK
ncbi:ALP1-like protein, partial [Tanacetum coccineum]